MKNGVKKSVISAIMICTVVVSSLGIGIAKAWYNNTSDIGSIFDF